MMLGAGALGRPRGMEWGGRREEGSGWGTHALGFLIMRMARTYPNSSLLVILTFQHHLGRMMTEI